MSALTLTVMFGVIGLAVDLGYGRYIHQSAQSAADAAVLAAASKALSSVGQTASFNCSTNVVCQNVSPCSASGNLQTGCLYAQQNGFTQGGASGRQTVSIGGGTSSTAPGISNVPGVVYWTQATLTQKSPQLFSTILGNTMLSNSVTSTAAIFPTQVTPSLYLLNRSSDCFVSLLNIGLVCGEDFLSLLSTSVSAGGGIYMSSSNSSSTALPNVAAATVVGSATVTSPFTYILGSGGVSTLGITNWSASPRNGFADGDDFRDPMRGKGQPPAPTGLSNHPVAGGVILASLLGGTTVLPPGNYYATNGLTGQPTGLPITIAGNVTFSDGSSPPCGGFCNYVFYGGLVTGALSTTIFSPGRYVFAGAEVVSGGPAVGFTAGVNSVVKDMTPLVNGQATQNTDAGEIFIFTDTNYSGLQVPSVIQNSGISFPQVTAGFQGGLGFSVTLHGLNAANSALPSELQTFAPVLLWQDQANTTLK